MSKGLDKIAASLASLGSIITDYHEKQEETKKKTQKETEISKLAKTLATQFGITGLEDVTDGDTLKLLLEAYRLKTLHDRPPPGTKPIRAPDYSKIPEGASVEEAAQILTEQGFKVNEATDLAVNWDSVQQEKQKRNQPPSGGFFKKLLSGLGGLLPSPMPLAEGSTEQPLNNLIPPSQSASPLQETNLLSDDEELRYQELIKKEKAGTLR